LWDFKFGRVFKVLWTEPISGTAFDKVGKVFKVLWSEPISGTAFGKVRRFVIIKSCDRQSICM
jgi:hypothetical protein